LFCFLGYITPLRLPLPYPGRTPPHLVRVVRIQHAIRGIPMYYSLVVTISSRGRCGKWCYDTSLPCCQETTRRTLVKTLLPTSYFGESDLCAILARRVISSLADISRHFPIRKSCLLTEEFCLLRSLARTILHLSRRFRVHACCSNSFCSLLSFGSGLFLCKTHCT
jgi:hypothetical protein